MTDERFHRIAVLANVAPATLRSFLSGHAQRPARHERICWALQWVDADDARRGRVRLWLCALGMAT